jgi:predicted glycogen debranching enzyme
MTATDVVRRIDWRKVRAERGAAATEREWLVTKGLGGYASGTLPNIVTRRYHGLLIAALPAPLGRTVMLSKVWERVRLADHRVAVIDGEAEVGECSVEGRAEYLVEFRLELGQPIWRYELGADIIEKQLLMPHLQNTVYVIYRRVSGEGLVRLTLRPFVHFRPHDAPVDAPFAGPYALNVVDDRYELSAPGDLPPLRLSIRGDAAAFTMQPKQVRQLRYSVEETRGYSHLGAVWSPGYFRTDLTREQPTTLIASTEDWETIGALGPDEALTAERERRRRLLSAAHPAARSGPAAELALAADQFIVIPAGRVRDKARTRAAGDEARTVLAGYHWFTDWGRDTMIALEGLTLVTGRHAEAGYVLRMFAQHIRDGLIPNMFPEGETEGVYHTADATLWFFHAIDRYLEITGDRETLRVTLPNLFHIVECHARGTRFGIGVDARDGLLRQGSPEHPLTWMDAKFGDWIVTPRRGKPVEINALWYNALRLLEAWAREEDRASAADDLGRRAERARASFNERFWYADGDYLYDVVDGEQGDDRACRPNQLLAISLRHPVLDPARWKSVLGAVRDGLLTPVGLRTLSPDHADYRPTYHGDLKVRDAAYHQGTVWPWLIGPFVDAWLRVHPGDTAGARRALAGLVPHLDEACVGSVSEIFDAQAPYVPRGCIAQAWSVAEMLRAWIKTTAR